MTLMQSNLLQIKLIKESGLKPGDWILQYAEKFRDLISKGVHDYESIMRLLYSHS